MISLPPVNASAKATMTLSQYIKNPVGAGTSNIAARKRIIDGMNNVFVKLLLNNKKAFSVKCYSGIKNTFIIHVKVPSEEFGDKLLYDVIFSFPFDISAINNVDLRSYIFNKSVKMWSNCPSFIFTYAYVYYHGGIGDPISAKYMLGSSIAVTQPPVMRNPQGTFGYEKSTYMAARYLNDSRIIDTDFIQTNTIDLQDTPDGYDTLYSHIPNSDLILKTYGYLNENRTLREKRLKTEAKKLDATSRNQYDTTREGEYDGNSYTGNAKKIIKNASRPKPKNTGAVKSKIKATTHTRGINK